MSERTVEPHAPVGVWRPSRLPMDETWRLVPLLILGLALWGWFDVRERAKIDPADPLAHKTDFTVYTEASRALLEGRDPYAVANIRGWHYLYPPLFALLLTPLVYLSPENQAYVWFLLSCGFAWGCYRECRRLTRLLLERDPAAAARRKMPPELLGWIVAAAAFFPTANAIQRGQVGVLLAYLLLLGFRLLVQSASWRGACAAGVVLALPVTIKLTPILPCGLLVLQQLIAAWRTGWSPLARGRAIGLTLGGVAGLALFLVVVPGALLGQRTNSAHLRTWAEKVVHNEDRGQDLTFNPLTIRNQSLRNALYRAGNYWAYAAGTSPDDMLLEQGIEPEQRAFALDHAVWFEPLVKGLSAGLLLLMLGGLAAAAWRSDELAQASAFGLACLLTLSISPISWGHHYTLALPATWLTSLWLWARQRTRSAYAAAGAALLLTAGHYAGLPLSGRVGWLGLGTAAWFAVAALLLWRGIPPTITTAIETRPRRRAA